jgi:hypothetical protein
MTAPDITHSRLFQQQISRTDFKTPGELVGWMGAMQAQDYAMSKWAVGVRLPGVTEEVVEDALNRGEILRTHVLRPTWHLVAAADIYWMLELTAPHILSSIRGRHRELELTEAIISKTFSILERVLAGGNSATREALMAELNLAGIATADNNRSAHLMMRAELDGLVCSGPAAGKQQTYALLTERVPRKITLSRAEALATLARRYFTSHGPATLQDFIWWSGLPVAAAKSAVESIRSECFSETIGTETYWWGQNASVPAAVSTATYLLPAFDEYIISYRNRSAMLPNEHTQKAVSDNGIFRPMVVVNGEVTGIWKRTVKSKTVLLEPDFFQPPGQEVHPLLEQAGKQFGAFLGKDVIIAPI